MSRRGIDFRLYLITDRKQLAPGYTLATAVGESLEGGVRAVQLREKDMGTRELLGMAYELRELTRRYQARLFINGRLDIALAVCADGVHLGVSDIPVDAARRAAGEDMLIGASAHGVREVRKVWEEGADFVTVGPVYETPSKMRYGRPLGLEILRKAVKEVPVPVFAIGGIKEDKVGEVLEAGACGVALISAVVASKDIKSTAEEFMRLLK